MSSSQPPQTENIYKPHLYAMQNWPDPISNSQPRFEKRLNDLYQQSLHPNDSPAYALDLIDRFNLLKQRIGRINQQIETRHQLTRNLLQKTREQLAAFQFQLEEHLNTWRSVGVNPSADSRRTFLESQVSRLEEKLYLIDIDHFNAVRDLERELFNLLPDYLQLKRVVKTLL